MICAVIKEKCIKESLEYFRVKHPERERLLGEVFTPSSLVLEILEDLPSFSWDLDKKFLDPTCGNGQFLAAVLIIKISLGHQNALSTIYGVDIMQDNVDECRQRLIDIAGDTPANWSIVNSNIRCADGLNNPYAYDFDTDQYKQWADTIAPKKEKVEIKEVKNNFDSMFG
jgi:type I restriction-modification system DNA methylase subunit